MKIACILEIDLEDIQQDYENELLNNEKVYEYISKNIDKSNKLRINLKNMKTGEVGNRGFLSQMIEEFNDNKRNI